MKKEYRNVTVVIRSAHERTETLCRKLILDQHVPEEQVFTIHEVPFSSALKKSFQIGLEENRTWTYCIDADVLLHPRSVKKMTEIAEKERKNVCEVQGFVMDKFFGGPRQAGNHLYRTALLDKIIECIPEEGVDIRPERYTLGKMAKMGYTWKSVPLIVGLHDHEQYYFDIYRKAYVYGIKHLDRAELLIKNWRKNAERDPDYQVALKAFSDSLFSTRKAFIDRSQELYGEKFQALDILEKEELDPQKITLQMVENIIQNWEYTELYFSYFPTRDTLDSNFTGFVNKIKRNYRKLGFVNLIKTGLRKVV